MNKSAPKNSLSSYDLDPLHSVSTIAKRFDKGYEKRRWYLRKPRTEYYLGIEGGGGGGDLFAFWPESQ